MDQLDAMHDEVDQALEQAGEAVAEARRLLAEPTRPDRMAGLEALQQGQQALDLALDRAVSLCRYLADSWTLIGATLGVSKQAARKRWLDNPGDAARQQILGRAS